MAEGLIRIMIQITLILPLVNFYVEKAERIFDSFGFFLVLITTANLLSHYFVLSFGPVFPWSPIPFQRIEYYLSLRAQLIHTTSTN